jgi:hypothetical protein
MSRLGSPDPFVVARWVDSVFSNHDEIVKHDTTPAGSAATPKEASHNAWVAGMNAGTQDDHASVEPMAASARFAAGVDVAPYITPQQAQAIDARFITYHVEDKDTRAALSSAAPRSYGNIDCIMMQAEDMEEGVAADWHSNNRSGDETEERSFSPTETADSATAVSQSKKRDCDADEVDQHAWLLANRVLQDINAVATVSKRRRAQPPLNPHPTAPDSQSEHGQATGGAATASSAIVLSVTAESPPPPPPFIAPAAPSPHLLAPATVALGQALAAPAMARTVGQALVARPRCVADIANILASDKAAQAPEVNQHPTPQRERDLY